MNQLADAMIATSFGATGDVALANSSSDLAGLQLSMDTMTARTDFTTTRTCRPGGQLVLKGTRDRAWDPDTHSGSSDLELTKTHEDCARPFQDTDGERDDLGAHRGPDQHLAGVGRLTPGAPRLPFGRTIVHGMKARFPINE